MTVHIHFHHGGRQDLYNVTEFQLFAGGEIRFKLGPNGNYNVALADVLLMDVQMESE